MQVHKPTLRNIPTTEIRRHQTGATDEVAYQFHVKPKYDCQGRRRVSSAICVEIEDDEQMVTEVSIRYPQLVIDEQSDIDDKIVRTLKHNGKMELNRSGCQWCGDIKTVAEGVYNIHLNVKYTKPIKLDECCSDIERAVRIMNNKLECEVSS